MKMREQKKRPREIPSPERKLVKFEFVKKTPQDPTACPKCGHKFTPVKEETISITYQVKVLICHTKQDPRDKTTITVESNPYFVLGIVKTLFPHSIEEMIETTEKLLKKYRAKGWVFGLGSDQSREIFADSLHQEDMVKKQINEAINWMRKFDYEPRFEKE